MTDAIEMRMVIPFSAFENSAFEERGKSYPRNLAGV
jgi:hypothetical protein